MTNSLIIGFIGFGEVATSMSEGLRENSSVRLLAYHHKGLDVPAKLLNQANDLGVELVESSAKLAEECHVVLNVTKASAAKESALAILPILTKEHVYVDLNSCNPAIMNELGEMYTRKGVPFVDGALMAPLPQTKHRVPILLAGPGAEKAAERLTPLGMNLEVVSSESGAASSVKMIRSVFMKGLAALMIETYTSAKLCGDGYEKVMESMKRTLSMPFENLLDRFLTGTIQHAGRRVGEMDNAIDFIHEMGLDPIMTKTTRDLLQNIALTKGLIGREGAIKEQDEIFAFYKDVYLKEEA